MYRGLVFFGYCKILLGRGLCKKLWKVWRGGVFCGIVFGEDRLEVKVGVEVVYNSLWGFCVWDFLWLLIGDSMFCCCRNFFKFG